MDTRVLGVRREEIMEWLCNLKICSYYYSKKESVIFKLRPCLTELSFPLNFHINFCYSFPIYELFVVSSSQQAVACLCAWVIMDPTQKIYLPIYPYPLILYGLAQQFCSTRRPLSIHLCSAWQIPCVPSLILNFCIPSSMSIFP